MSHERGTYRSIMTVLVDGPDYQALSPMAKLVLLTLKLNLGPSGIDVLYPAILEAQTGLSGDQVLLALDTLGHAGWLHRERNVIWVCGQLEHEPNMRAKDKKHRAGVQSHCAGLPRLGIVARFVREHPDWFPEAEAAEHELSWVVGKAIEAPEKGQARPFEGPPKGLRSTETENGDGERRRNLPADAGGSARRDGPKRPHWLAPACAVYETRYGAKTFPWGEAGRPLKPIHEAGASPEVIAANLARYLEATDPQYVNIARFAKTFEAWGEPPPIVDPETGLLTPVAAKRLGLAS